MPTEICSCAINQAGYSGSMLLAGHSYKSLIPRNSFSLYLQMPTTEKTGLQNRMRGAQQSKD